MPPLDAHLQFSSDQALTADAISENVLDLAPLTGGSGVNLIRDIGAGQQVGVVVQVETALESAGEAATLTVTVESDSVVALDDSATVHYTSAAIAEATLAAGYTLFFLLPPGAYERYIGLRYNAGTEDFTGGTINAWLVIGDSARWRTYASGFTNNVA